MTIVAVSGGFDPVHVGHIDLFADALKYGDKLIVILNNDEFLLRKKGFVFMPLEERKKILESIRYVDEVVVSIDKDQTVRETLRLIHPDIFVKSANRKGHSEADVCNEIGCQRIYIGEKVQSSSKLVERVIQLACEKCQYKGTKEYSLQR